MNLDPNTPLLNNQKVVMKAKEAVMNSQTVNTVGKPRGKFCNYKLKND